MCTLAMPLVALEEVLYKTVAFGVCLLGCLVMIPRKLKGYTNKASSPVSIATIFMGAALKIFIGELGQR